MEVWTIEIDILFGLVLGRRFADLEFHDVQ